MILIELEWIDSNLVLAKSNTVVINELNKWDVNAWDQSEGENSE